jgi:hypothetical protein
MFVTIALSQGCQPPRISPIVGGAAICRADAEHYDWMPVQSVQQLTPCGQRHELTHSQCVDVANSAAIEIARARMVQCVGGTPNVVRR